MLNPYAYGNAWFVNEIRYVANANEEINALDSIQPMQTAVVDSRFKQCLNGVQTAFKDSTSSIMLTSYAPNKLVYQSHSPQAGVVVFSEIYYPGWKATIDGQPVEIARVNYILRAISVPAGKHTITMTFDPESLHVTERIAYGGLIVLLLGIIILLYKCRKSLPTSSKK
ncbi:hypothetical protein SDC9_69303 [bioreactor metagenome]|uniref:YfhO family protein n=1 Tax=bioreactor metagenome TaxID=1076179 RepID=A0A644Y9Q9_9ZZZZ